MADGYLNTLKVWLFDVVARVMISLKGKMHFDFS